MEAVSELQHQTRVNSGAGRSVWVSMPSNATPDIQSRQDGSRSGRGRKAWGLTLGDLHRSPHQQGYLLMQGRPIGNNGPKPKEKSDHLIVVMKPGNAGGVKGVTV